MEFLNSTNEDLEEIFRLYDLAIEFQKTKFDKFWLPFERQFIEREITEKRHWKITIDEEIACVFSINFDDSLIWKDVRGDEAVYLHRVAVNPDFRGTKFFPTIVEWLRGYAKKLGKQFVRMDTWDDNEKLINYYVNCGFDFLGVTIPAKTESLPKHYEAISLGLFEMKID